MPLYFAGTAGKETPPRPGAPHGGYEVVFAFSDQPPQDESLVKVIPTIRRILFRVPKGATVEQLMVGLDGLIQRCKEIKDVKDTEAQIITVSGGNGG